MLSSRQILLHYLALFGVFNALLQVFVIYGLFNNILSSFFSILFVFLFIIAIILNTGRFHPIAILIYTTVSVASVVVWSMYFPKKVEISWLFIPLSMMTFRLFENDKFSWLKLIVNGIYLLGVIFIFNLEGKFYEFDFNTKTCELMNHTVIILCIIISIIIVKYIIQDVRMNDKNDFEAKQNLKFVFENLKDSLLVVDHEYKLKWSNHYAVHKFLKVYNVQIITGKKVYLFFPKEFQQAIIHGIDQALKGTIFGNEQTYLQSNITKIYLQYLYLPVYDNQTNIIGVAIKITNVTDSVVSENELVRQKHFLEELFNESPDSLFLVSFNSEKIISYNNTAKIRFALSDDSNIISFRKLFDKRLSLNFWDIQLSTLQKEGQINFEAICFTDDHQIFSSNTQMKILNVLDTKQILISISDISELVQQRELKFEMLRLENQHMENMLSQKNLAMMIQGQEQERKRISKELHDGIGQMLTAIRLQVNGLELNQKEQFNVERQEAKEMIDSTILEVKRISNNLMPSLIVDLGLFPALEKLFSNHNDGLVVGFNYDNKLKIQYFNTEQEIGIYRILQEAFNNSLKYSKASQIQISIVQEDSNKIKIIFVDNGIGFEMSLIDNSLLGHGLVNMKERARMINAEFEMISSIGKGVQIIISVPLKELGNEEN